MLDKVAGGVLLVGLVSVGGVAMTKPEWLGMDGMPSWTPLSKDHDYKTKEAGTYQNKFGGENKENLVGVVGDKKGANDKNSVSDWWEWSFKKLQQDGIDSGEFAVTNTQVDKIKVKSAYAPESDTTNPSSALNRVCEKAYKAETAKVKEKPTATDGTEFNEVHVWKYCSPLGQKPDPTVQS